MMRSLFKTEHDISATILRVILAAVIFGHGAQKLLGWWGGHGVSETIAMWKQWWNMPAFITFLVIIAESFGAVALFFGFMSRIVSASIGIIMVGAVWMLHLRWGFYMNWYAQPQRGEGFEYHLLTLAIVVVLVIKGGGAYSVDRMIARRN